MFLLHDCFAVGTVCQKDLSDYFHLLVTPLTRHVDASIRFSFRWRSLVAAAWWDLWTTGLYLGQTLTPCLILEIVTGKWECIVEVHRRTMSSAKLLWNIQDSWEEVRLCCILCVYWWYSFSHGIFHPLYQRCILLFKTQAGLFVERPAGRVEWVLRSCWRRWGS